MFGIVNFAVVTADKDLLRLGIAAVDQQGISGMGHY